MSPQTIIILHAIRNSMDSIESNLVAQTILGMWNYITKKEREAIKLELRGRNVPDFLKVIL